jgi:predicted flavoprotein YhiN
MRPNKNKIYNHLITCQQRFGGYTGKDLDDIARKLGFDRRTIKRNVEKWSKTDPSFAELEYIGKQSIIITLENIAIINQRLKEKIASKKQDIILEINDIFSYTDLKTFGGIDIDNIASRLLEAQKWFHRAS